MKRKFTLFSGIDLRSLALFRIFLGTALILDLLFYKFPYRDAFYSETGIFPIETACLLGSSKTCSLLFYLHSDWGVILFFIITLLIYFSFTLGYKTRWAAVLSYVCLYSMHARNQMSVFGSDVILRVLLFWSIFLPLNIFFSVTPPKNRPKKLEIRNVFAFAVLFQIGVIYFFNAFLKTGPSWRNGEALGFILTDFSLKAPLSDWLLSHPDLYRLFTHGTLLFEYLIVFFIFSPWFNSITRTSTVILIFIFHWGMMLFMNVGTFYLSALPTIAILLPRRVWKRRSKKNDNVNSFSSESNIKIEKVTRIYKAMPFITYLKNICIGFLLLTIVLMNLGYRFESLRETSKFFHTRFCGCTGLKQAWNLFAPEPARNLSYTLVLGNVKDTLVDLYSDEIYNEEKIILHPENYNSLPFTFSRLNYSFEEILLRNNRVGLLMGENWADYEYRRWKKKNNGDVLKSVFLVRVRVECPSPGKLSDAKVRLMYRKDF